MLINAKSPGKPGFFTTVLWAGFLVGSLNIATIFTTAWLQGRVPPAFILKYIASGLFGSAAFKGGNDAVIYGLIIHFAISYSFTLLFVLAYGKITFLSKSKILTGVGYGLFIWLVMNYLIIPFTALPKGHFNLTQAAIGAIILMAVIGIPLSFITADYYAARAKH